MIPCVDMGATKLSSVPGEGFPYLSILKFQKQVKFCIYVKLELMGTLQGVIWVAKYVGETSSLVVSSEMPHEKEKT